MTVPEQRLIDVGGATLEVLIGGAAEPVVCITHPSAEQPTAEDWDEWAGDLGDRRVVWVNPRGVGRSSPVRLQRELTFAQLVDDLDAVRAGLGIDRWVYLGGSSGGCIGLLYALRYPRSLAGLIVEFSTPSAAFIADPAFEHDFKPSFVRLGDGTYVNLAHRSFDDLTIQLRANLDELGVFDVRDRLGEIALPTLVVAGRHDTTHPPAHARAIHEGIPGSEWLLLAHSGHGAVAAADRDRYRTAVARFLAGLAAPAPGGPS
jgi:pimeloyl-ACP methyl ester carboxylesterase